MFVVDEDKNAEKVVRLRLEKDEQSGEVDLLTVTPSGRKVYILSIEDDGTLYRYGMDDGNLGESLGFQLDAEGKIQIKEDG